MGLQSTIPSRTGTPFRDDGSARDDWDRLVARTPHSDVAQLCAWADVRAPAGYDASLLMVRRDGAVLGGAQVLHRRVPGVGRVAYLPSGPVLPTDGPDGHVRAEVRDALCDDLAALARHRFAALFVQPMRGGEDVGAALLERGFRPSTAGIAPTASLEVDLTPPVDRLRAGMRSGTRSGVKRAVAQGVRVRRGTVDDLPAVAGLFGETAAHHGFAGAAPDHLDRLYRALDPGRHVHVFLAERDGVPLAADLFTASGGTLTLRLTGMRRDDDARRTGAAALLRWEAMLWARAHDLDAVDLGGIPPAAVGPVREGARDLAARVDGRTYFKASFGGRAFHLPPAVELIPSAPVRVVYDLARRSTGGRRLVTAAKAVLRGTGARGR